MYAYAHTPLDEETIKLTSFSSDDKLFAFIGGFYGLRGLPTFFTKQKPTFFKTLIEQGFATVYIDDFLHLSNSKENMFQLIEQLHNITTRNNLKVAPQKSFFMLLEGNFPGHEIGYNTNKPIQSKNAAYHKIPSSTRKIALTSFIGALNFYTEVIEKLHFNLKPFYNLLHENTPWTWTDEHKILFQKLKMSLTSETELTIPNTKHPFFITPLTTGTPFLHAYCKRFSPFSEDSTNLISLYTTKTNPSTTSTPLLRISYAILLESVFLSGCLELSLTNFMNILIQVSRSPILRSLNISIIRILKSGSPFSKK